MPEDQDFYVPDGIYDWFADGIGRRGLQAREAWQAMFETYRAAYPELAGQIEQMQHRSLPDGWADNLPEFKPDAKGLATRDSSGQVLNAVARHVPWLVGGSADLTPSTKTHLTFDGAGDFQPDDRPGRNLHYGIREELEADGIGTRVVSMPCWELFDRQPPEYREQVLPREVTARVAVEQASTLGWDRYVGDGGAVVGMHTFGASAPLKQLLTRFGFTPERVAEVARERLAAARHDQA
jgi:transketolase